MTRLARSLSALYRGSSTFRSLAAPCSYSRSSPPRSASLVRRRAPRASGGSGPPDTNEAGESPRFTRGTPTSAAGRCLLGGVVFLRARSVSDRLWHPCRLLFLDRRAPRFSESRALIQRPPRPVPRVPRERRALLRPGMPSICSRHTQRVRAEARTNPRGLLLRAAFT